MTGLNLRAADRSMTDAICAFCSRPVEMPLATMLVAHPPLAVGEAQTLYCHGSCLTERLAPGIPLHPDIADSQLGGEVQQHRDR